MKTKRLNTRFLLATSLNTRKKNILPILAGLESGKCCCGKLDIGAGVSGTSLKCKYASPTNVLLTLNMSLSFITKWMRPSWTERCSWVRGLWIKKHKLLLFFVPTLVFVSSQSLHRPATEPSCVLLYSKIYNLLYNK